MQERFTDLGNGFLSHPLIGIYVIVSQRLSVMWFQLLTTDPGLALNARYKEWDNHLRQMKGFTLIWPVPWWDSLADCQERRGQLQYSKTLQLVQWTSQVPDSFPTAEGTVLASLLAASDLRSMAITTRAKQSDRLMIESDVTP